MTRQEAINHIVRNLSDYTLATTRTMFANGDDYDKVAAFVVESNEKDFAVLRTLFTDEELEVAVHSY